MAALRAISFDAVGTLIRLREPVETVYARIGGAHGFSVDEVTMGGAFREAWEGLPQPQHGGIPSADDDRSWWRELVMQSFGIATGTELPAGDAEELFADLYSHYARPDAWTVFEDVPDALASLADRCRLLVLSNFDRRLRGILTGLGLSRFFQAMIISSEVGASKPSRLIFEAAARAAGSLAHECLHVGDDELLDIRGARNAGLQTFHIQRPQNDLNLLVQNVRDGHFKACRADDRE